MHLLAALLLALTPGAGQLVPPRAGMVNDYAHILVPDSVVELELTLQEVRRGSQAELVLVTLLDLRGADPQDVADEVRKSWGIGGTGDSVWPGLVMVYERRQQRFAFSYNDVARPWISPAELERIAKEIAIPKLESGRESDGIRDLMRAVARIFR